MKTKKLIAFVLTIVMLCSIAAPMAFAAEKNSEYPIIYVTGSRHKIYADKTNPSESNRVWKIGVDIGATVKEALAPCLKELAAGIITDDYDKYCDELVNHIVPLFEKVVLDNNGEASNGSGIECEAANYNYPKKSSDFALMDYNFWYDWRLSPMVVGEQLKNHIDNVKALTGKDKVVIVARCMGANITSAYFTKYYDHAVENVDSIMMYEPSNLGLDVLGAIYSGQLYLDDDRVNEFLDYFVKNGDLLESEETGEFISALVAVLNEVKVLGIATDLINQLLEKVKANLIPRLLLGTFGTFPSFWSMVGEDYYEEAREFIFGGREEEYKGLIEKNDEYYYSVTKGLPERMEKLVADGVEIGVLVKYNIPSYPFYEKASQQTDMVSDVYHVSFYATSAPYGEVLSDSYINGLADKKYLSPDKMIDASTCLFPEKTWFIRNISHDPFPPSIDELIYEYFNQNGKLTVFDNEKFPQYMDYDSATDTLSPIKAPAEEKPDDSGNNGGNNTGNESGKDKESVSIFMRFITAILNFFAKLFKR